MFAITNRLLPHSRSLPLAAALRLLLTSGVALSGSVAFADHQVTLMTSPSIPPYAIAAENDGAVVDVLKQALAPQGYSLHLGYASNRRLAQMIETHSVDGVYNLPCESDGKGVYYSAPIINYHNVVVTRASSHLHIDSIADLAHKRVVAFQNAPKYLPAEAASIARDNPQYREVADQALQIDILYAGHADAIILDSQIFSYYLARSKAASASPDSFVTHPLFPPAPRCAAFGSAALRDAVNLGVERLHSSGEYDRILARYLQPEQSRGYWLSELSGYTPGWNSGSLTSLNWMLYGLT